MPPSILKRYAVFRPVVHPLERRVLLDAGVLDTAFGDEGVVSIPADTSAPQLTDVAVMPDGRLVVTGTSLGDGRLNVMRLHPDGSFDTTFGDGGRAVTQLGGNAQALAVSLQPDHKPVVVGMRGNQLFILRYQTNGKHDRTFGDGGLVRLTFDANVSSARDVAVLNDGSILVAGHAVQANASTAVALARFTSTGQLDQSFGTSGTVMTKFSFGLSDNQTFSVNRMDVAPDDRIVLAGRFFDGVLRPTQPPESDAVAVMRFNPDGSADTTFGGNGLALAEFGTVNETGSGAAVDAAGRPVVAVRGADAFSVLRLQANGRRDLTFGTNGLARISPSDGDTHDVLIDSQGNYVLAGAVRDEPRLARMLNTGAPDGMFGDAGISEAVPFASPAELSRVVQSPDNTYLLAGTGGPDQRPPSGAFQLAKYFASDHPAGTLHARSVRAPLSGSYVFQVQWRDAQGIDVTTIGPNNLRLTGPGGYARSASVVSIDQRMGDTNVFVRYKVPPPNGSVWVSADNGPYTISVLADGVRNLDGTPVEASVLGTFQVLIA